MKRDDAALAQLSATLRADPPADAVIGAILGPLDDGPDMAAIALLNREIARWQHNADLDGWRAGADLPSHVVAALEGYVAAARSLPAWADPARIARAEQLFMELGMTSCTLLFCASLPQCYVVPDLAAVLHVAGQLEQHTDYRVRATAAMIFPVMMRGGLTDAAGGGVAQALKVRLIHATIRHLILRGAPAQAGHPLPKLPARGPGMQQALYAHGWDTGRLGLPCNQEELAYTLLTFGYVFLQGLRRLGIGLPAADEEAFLHAWNVLGHLLGIERGLMADTMDEARAMFEAIQSRGRAAARTPDPRPALGRALVGNLRAYIPLDILKPFPALLTRHLCGKAASRDLGLEGRVAWASRLAFALAMSALRAIDRTGRLFSPGFSLARLASRILGYHLTVTLLMDQTRPLKLPDALLNQVGSVVRAWQADPHAPRWMNAVEYRFTGRSRSAVPAHERP